MMPTPCVEHTLSNSVDTSSEAASSLKEEEKKKKKISPFNRDDLLAEMSDAYGLCVLMTSDELEQLGGEGGLEMSSNNKSMTKCGAPRTKNTTGETNGSLRSPKSLEISSSLPSMDIFVFGSNLAGRHGRGAALFAVKHHDAIYGCGVGIQGNAYAIPTKDENLRVLPLDKIQLYIGEFIQFAHEHPEMEFNVTKIGCGLAGYKPAQIRPFFEGWMPRLANVNLPIEFGGTRDVFTDKDGEESK